MNCDLKCLEKKITYLFLTFDVTSFLQDFKYQRQSFGEN